MNIDNIRKLYKIGMIVALLLFIVMAIDHFANDSGMLVGLTVVFAIVAIAMFALLFVRPSEDGADEQVPVDEAEPVLEDYPGDVHEVVDLEGIGPKYAGRLHEAGILHTQQLLFTPDDDLVSGVGVQPKVVQNWKSMAQLVKVSGIGPQYAEALTRGGVNGIEDLRDGDVTAIATQVNEYLDGLQSTVIGQRISEKRVKTWQAAARKMQKVPINMDRIKVRALESKAARADAA